MPVNRHFDVRLPIGSLLLPTLLSSSGTSMPPRISVFGAVFDSTTLIHGFSFDRTMWDPQFPGLVYLSTHDVDGPFNKIASPSVLMNSGSAQKPGSIGTGYKPGVQAWYNQSILVDPDDADHLFVGLEEVYETRDAGTHWYAVSPYWNFEFRTSSHSTQPPL